MSAADGALGAAAAYGVPRYRAPEGAPWLHALHGNVPGHEIDFIYCPEVPHGPFTLTHFSHLARLLKYIEPWTGSPFAFAIGNLSRDDTQHEPGHGGVALVLGLRVSGVRDGAGRQEPPFAHAIAAIDRDLGGGALLDSTLAFLGSMAGGGDRGPSPVAFYRAYARCAEERPESVPELLGRYVEGFGDLPALPPVARSADWAWEVDEGARPGRLVIVHRDDEPFERIARMAARLAVVLYRSNIRWTSIVSGGQADISGGLSIQLVPRSQAGAGAARLVLSLDQVPEGQEEIARELFGARRVDRSRRCVPDWRVGCAPGEDEREAEPDDAAGEAGEDSQPGGSPGGRAEVEVEAEAEEGRDEQVCAAERVEDDEPTLVRRLPERLPLAAPKAEEEETLIEVTVELEGRIGEGNPAAAAEVEAPARREVEAPARREEEYGEAQALRELAALDAAHPVLCGTAATLPSHGVARSSEPDEIDLASLGLPSRRWRWIGLGLGGGLASLALFGLLELVDRGAAGSSSPLPLQEGPAQVLPPAIVVTAQPPAIRPEPAPAPVVVEAPARLPGRASGALGRGADPKGMRPAVRGTPRSILRAPPVWTPASPRVDPAKGGRG